MWQVNFNVYVCENRVYIEKLKQNETENTYLLFKHLYIFCIFSNVC